MVDLKNKKWMEADIIDAVLKIHKVIDSETFHRLRTLQEEGYNKKRASERLGIDESTLRADIKKIGKIFRLKKS